MLRCRVEGWPLQPPVKAEERIVLVQLAEETLGRLPWPSLPAVSFDAEREVLVVEALLPAAGSPERSRGLRRLAAVAMVMCQARPLWLWTIRDDAGALAADLGAEDLVAWRGIFGRHPYPSSSSAWSAVDVRKDQAFDQQIRRALAEALGEELESLGLRSASSSAPPPRGSGGSGGGEVVLFDYQPGPGWQSPGVEALLVVGRSMVQLDGRRSDGRHRLQGRIEVHNPSRLDLAGARAQVRVCDAQGSLLAVVEGELSALPAGTTRVILVQAEVRLGGREAATVDIGCEAQLTRSVSFQARVVGADGRA